MGKTKLNTSKHMSSMLKMEPFRGLLKMAKKATNKQKAAIIEYNKNNYRRINLSLHKTYETDLIEQLEKQENIAGYIKNLIRADMEKGSE